MTAAKTAAAGLLAAILLHLSAPAMRSATPEVVPGTARLEDKANFSTLIVDQWNSFLLGETARARTARPKYWQRDYSSPQAYARSMAANRDRLQRCIGAIDERLAPSDLEWIGGPGQETLRAETPTYAVLSVRWPVFSGVNGEGLLIKPKGEPRACMVVIPDADQIPEMLAGLNSGVPPESQFARRLAESGVMILIPTLIDRRSLWSADERLGVQTDHSHREWIYRQAAEVGRHIIGYEVQKVRAAIDWLLSANAPAQKNGAGVGVAGYGEGGLLALCTAALDDRVAATWVSGYFQAREQLWQEPLYRNLWGFLNEFGDAELAAMIAPRALVVEYSRIPEVVHPLRPDGTGAGVRRISSVGRIATPDFSLVASEWKRAMEFAGPFSRQFALVSGVGSRPVAFGSAEATRRFGRLLGLPDVTVPSAEFTIRRPLAVEYRDARQHRQVRELQGFSQERLRLAEYGREEFFWAKLESKNPEQWRQAMKPLRDYFWDEVIGRFPDATDPLNARTRVLSDRSDSRVTTYEVILDVRPGVYTWGYLLLPADLNADERRPVVVCQHGVGGQPASTLEPKGPYQAFARKLAERGFVVYAPYNPDKGHGVAAHELQRKGDPLKKSVFGIFTANHQCALKWLKQQPFVDPDRIAFYGLSYGGKTAVRVPALLEEYCLSICSGDWNDYVKKVTSLRSETTSLMFYDSPESVQFNMGNTFNYAEMAALIAPRPFMVEHGYKDTVAPLEWAAAEYAKVQKLYFRLGIPERTAMAFFDGPHMIHGGETFPFLHRYLRWPDRPAQAAISPKASDRSSP